MTNYSIKEIAGTFYVVNDDENFVVGTPYTTEAKAKRRIRDLKAKEAEAAKRIGEEIAFNYPNNNTPFTGKGGGLSQLLPVYGVYPAISKHRHQRRAYG